MTTYPAFRWTGNALGDLHVLLTTCRHESASGPTPTGLVLAGEHNSGDWSLRSAAGVVSPPPPGPITPLPTAPVPPLEPICRDRPEEGCDAGQDAGLRTVSSASIDKSVVIYWRLDMLVIYQWVIYLPICNSDLCLFNGNVSHSFGYLFFFFCSEKKRFFCQMIIKLKI